MELIIDFFFNIREEPSSKPFHQLFHETKFDPTAHGNKSSWGDTVENHYHNKRNLLASGLVVALFLPEFSHETHDRIQLIKRKKARKVSEKLNEDIAAKTGW